MNWSQVSVEEALRAQKTSKNGLKNAEARKRLSQYGLNELKKVSGIPWWKILLGQFANLMVMILLVAMFVSAAVGEWIDAVAILVIVIVNAVIGFIQEYKAEKAIEALKRMAAPHAVVLREGESLQIPARELVPGDIVILEEGMKVPADARLIQVTEMSVEEASLTGESAPIFKEVRAIKGEKALGDRLNMVFMGTTLVRGHGMAMVVDTGMKTEFGKIADLVQAQPEGFTPLQKKLDHLSKVLAIIVLVAALLLFVEALIAGKDLIEVFILSISLAVSAIPEGLPAVITLTLALGVQQMAKKNAIVRKLSAAETLGSTSVICTDKTGTLTENQMTVQHIYANGTAYEVGGRGYKPEGKLSPHSKHLDKLATIAALCNNARLLRDKGQWVISGDPTEGCLITLARKIGLTHEELEKKHARLDELIFDSTRKRMSTVNQFGNKKLLLTKGAPDSVLEVCTHIEMNGKIKTLTTKLKKELLKQNEDYAKQALRVLAFAYKPLKSKEKAKESKLIFVGMVGMIDPARREVKDAIKTCHSAHIRVVMITGDHALTAQAIGHDIGLYQEGDKVVTGQELDKMSAAELKKIIEEVKIFARVNPHHKAKILTALKKKGHIVAMTGDGVNDAPALKSADIGIAMGITGTDVAKEASDMILTDDNFATIVASVKSGRTIYRNIKKFITFLLSANFDEIILISVVFALDFPIPFLPLQILWVNLLTDAVPAIALGSDPPEDNIMSLKPRQKDSNIFKEILNFSLVAGLLSAVVSLIIYFSIIHDGTVEHTRTMMFTTIVVFEMMLVFSVRYPYDHYFKNFFKNHFLFLGVLGSLALQLFAIYTPFMQNILQTVPLTLKDWGTIIAYSALAVLVIEVWKHFRKAPDHV